MAALTLSLTKLAFQTIKPFGQLPRPRKPWETAGKEDQAAGSTMVSGGGDSKGKAAATVPSGTVLPDYSIDAKFPPPPQGEGNGGDRNHSTHGSSRID
jgi:hypothetical protein